jgi:hypothetical protein
MTTLYLGRNEPKIVALCAVVIVLPWPLSGSMIGFFAHRWRTS